MKPRALLHWIEYGLLAVGLVLGAWCVAVLAEAHYYQALPVPSPPAYAAATLPGEEPGDGPRPERRTKTAAVEPGGWVARLEAPSVNLSATVLEGTDDRTLSRGAGHIEGTPFPGQPGNVGIAGHRDTTFRAVRKLRLGDPLIIMTADRVYRYRITAMQIVNPEDVHVLDPLGHPTLTLVTCYPFVYVGHAPRRFIVSADLMHSP